MKVKVKLLNPEARLPAYGRPGDAGLDVCCIEDKVLQPGERYLFKTGFAMELPVGTVALAWDRGGLSTKHGIHSLAGVIDSNYRGEVHILLFNASNEPYQFKSGDKIAQLVIQRYEQVAIVEAEELSESDRGGQGWFSSGR